MAEDIDVVFRDWNVPGIPGSGEYEPEKPRIRNLLKQIEASGGQSVTRNTLAELNAVTPPTENYGGIVLNDPDAANNGYYAREAGAWVRGRGFPDTFAEGILSGPASAQIASFSPGVNPSDIEVFWSRVSTVNVGPMTLNGKAVLSVAGAPLIANEWSGVVLYVDEGANWRLLIDVNAAQIASQAASSAAGSAVAAEDAADRAEAAASGVEFPVSYAPQSLTPEQQAQARDNIGVDQYAVTPEMFGAVASTDLNNPIISTEALKRLADYLSDTSAPCILRGIYASDEPLEFNASSLCIRGGGSGTGFLFLDCDGMALAQEHGLEDFDLSDFVMLTDSVNLHRGFAYACETNKNTPSQINRVNFLGLDRYLRVGGNTGWLNEISLTNGQYTYMNDVRIVGREADIGSGGFPYETVGVSTDRGSQLFVSGCSITRKKTGVYVSGFSEGVEIDRALMIGNYDSVVVEAADEGETPSVVDFNIRNSHMNSAHRNIVVRRADGSSIANIFTDITGNLLFIAGDNAGTAHIEFDGVTNSRIQGNDFYTPGGMPKTNPTTGVIVNGEARRNLVLSNQFFFIDTAMDVATAANTIFADQNLVYDHPSNTSSPLVIADNGAVFSGQNYGARRNQWPGATILEGGPNGTVLGVTNVANAVNRIGVVSAITGSPAILRTEGDDTTIDLYLQAKGGGHVRVNRNRVASSDAAITGYIEIKDGGGVIRKLAIID